MLARVTAHTQADFQSNKNLPALAGSGSERNAGMLARVTAHSFYSEHGASPAAQVNEEWSAAGSDDSFGS